jgi:hypothetical protein
LGESRLSTRDQVVDAIADPLVRARPAAIPIAALDRSEADDFGELADRLEQRSAAGAQNADQLVRACASLYRRALHATCS